jgi:D-alanyl-D-alanine carboxypeptidase-like protein
VRRSGLVVAALVGAVAGGALVLSMPVPGEPAARRPRDPSAPVARRPSVSDEAVIGKAPIRTLLAWTPGGLPSGFAGSVDALPSVREVAEVRSGVAWLDAWADRGSPRETPPPRLRIPVEVAAVEPPAYVEFVPPADRAGVRALGGNRAILGETGARLRDVGPGGTLRFGPVTLRVTGILPDELIGGHEVLVAAETGARLGITSPRYLLVSPERRAPLRRVEAGVGRAVPPGVRIRIRAPGETPVFRHGDAVLAPVRLKELFGEFAAAPVAGGFLRQSPAWVRENIRRVTLPVLGTFPCHRLVIPMVRGAVEELVRRGLEDEIHGFAGCYSPRFANRDPGAGLSHHAWGVALDINAAENPLGAEPTLDRRVVEVFERWGFTWGGRWLVPDGMHFEFLHFPQSD